MLYHRDTPTKRPYRRAGSPACTARVYRFSHRRTATATSSLTPAPCQYAATTSPSPLTHLPTASAAFYSERTNASFSEKAHLSQPHLTPLRLRSPSPLLSLPRPYPQSPLDEQLRAQARTPYSRGLAARSLRLTADRCRTKDETKTSHQGRACVVSVRASISTTAYS